MIIMDEMDKMDRMAGGTIDIFCRLSKTRRMPGQTTKNVD